MRKNRMKTFATLKRMSLAALMLLTMSWVWVSCSEEDTTDTTPFALYYMTLTDIGPSMSGELAAPTYKGSAPSDFTIYKVHNYIHNIIYFFISKLFSFRNMMPLF